MSKDKPEVDVDPLPKDNAVLESQLTRSQTRLANDINELVDRFSPKALMERAKNSAKEKAETFFVAENGEPHLPRIAATGAAVLGVVAAVVGLGVKNSKK